MKLFYTAENTYMIQSNGYRQCPLYWTVVPWWFERLFKII